MTLTWPTAAKGREERGEGEGGGDKETGRQGDKETLHPKHFPLSSCSRSPCPLPLPTHPLSPLRVGFVELPGSRRVFNLGNRHWDEAA